MYDSSDSSLPIISHRRSQWVQCTSGPYVQQKVSLKALLIMGLVHLWTIPQTKGLFETLMLMGLVHLWTIPQTKSFFGSTHAKRSSAPLDHTSDKRSL